MKKVKKLLAVLLVFVMAFGLAGFTDIPEELSDVAGLYRGEVDVTELLIDALAEMKSMGGNPEAHFQGILFDIYLELMDDGNYHLFADLGYGMYQIRQGLKTMMKELVENQVGRSMTDEEVSEVLGEGWEDSLMESFETGFKEGAGEEISEEGTYTLNGSTLTFDGMDSYELKNGSLIVDMGDPFGEIMLSQVDEPVFVVDGLFVINPELFGYDYQGISEDTELRLTELTEVLWYGQEAEECDAFFGGIDMKLLFQDGELTAVWHDEEADEVDAEALETADALLERFDDSGDFYWRFTDEDQAEFPETEGVSLTMWAKAEEDDEPACFRQFWYSADYQE